MSDEQPVDLLVAALVRAQAKFTAVLKTQTNPHFGNKYADWADCLNMARPILAAEGLAFTQPVDTDEDGTWLWNVLDHESGQQRKAKFPAPTNLKPQDMIGWLTYMKRGLGQAFLGFHPEGEDDDGNTANAATPRTKTRQEPRERAYTTERGGDTHAPVADGGKPASDAQVRFLEDLSTQQGWSDAERALVFKKLAGIISDPITKATASALIPELKRIAKKELVVVWNDDGEPVIGEPAAHAADGTEPF